MGYVFVYSRNVIVDGTVHATLRDAKLHHRQPGLYLPCTRTWHKRLKYKHTKRKVTCLECIGIGWA